MPVDPRRFFGEPRPPTPEVHEPAERYALNVHQAADWMSGEGAREEIRAICRRWLADHPRLRHVDVSSLERVLERIERIPGRVRDEGVRQAA